MYDSLYFLTPNTICRLALLKNYSVDLYLAGKIITEVIKQHDMLHYYADLAAYPAGSNATLPLGNVKFNSGYFDFAHRVPPIKMFNR